MRSRLTLPALAVALLATLVVAPLVGQHEIAWADIIGNGSRIATTIFWQIRVPRVLMAMIAGTVLALGGMTFQAMFRNPLATPFTLGIASGASLGASIFILIGAAFPPAIGLLGVTGFAWLGAVGSMLTVWAIARARGLNDSSLLLAGVAVSFFYSSLILLLQYIADFTRSARMLRWVMGGLERGIAYGDFVLLAPCAVIGTAVILFCYRELNLVTLGDDVAMSRGLDVPRFKLRLFVLVSLLIGAVVAICGPIGFVGLIVPHICRLVVGADHARLAPATAMTGAIFLTVCDTLGRTLLPHAELPVGIITAICGGPFFLWLLLRKK